MKKLILLGVLIGSCPLWALDAPNPTSPTNEITNAYTRQQFYWELVSGAGSYELQVDTTKAFNSPVLEQRTFTTNSSQYVYHFRYNTHYYWRMRSVSQSDEEVKSDWCAVREFTTLSQVDLVSPSQPDGARYYYPKQTFKWKNSYGSTGYVIEIDTVPTFHSKAKYRTTYSSYASNTTKELTKDIGDLYLDCICYWRVKAYNNSDSSAWSEVYQFPTIARIQGTSPKDLVNAYTTQTFEWTYKSGLNYVIIELDTTEGFNSPAKRTVQSSGSSQDYCYTTISEMYFGKDYYWRVKAYHSKDTTEWSDVLHFKTYKHCTLTEIPTDSATEVSTTPYLYFNTVKGISYYQQQIDTTPLFNSPLMESKTEYCSSESSYNYSRFEDLYFGTTYYRRTRRCHSKDTSDWSPTRCFTTVVRGAYSTTSGYASIAKGATGISIRPKLYYYYRSFIDSVEIQIDTTVNFDSPLLESIRAEASSTQAYSYEYPKSDLLYGTTYYWRIRNSHSKDVSEWTYPRYFTTMYQLSKPTLCEPANQTIVQNGEVVSFAWNSTADATTYVYQLSDDGQFNTWLHQETVTDTTTLLVPPSNSILYWRVQAMNEQGRSPWSDVRGVNTTGASTSLNENVNKNANQTRKVIDNGQLYIIKDERRYDVLGEELF